MTNLFLITRSFFIIILSTLWGISLFFSVNKGTSQVDEILNRKQTVIKTEDKWIDDIELMLPKKIEALVGIPFRIYFENLISVKDINLYEVEIKGIKAKKYRRYWELTPTVDQIGIHDISFALYKNGKKDILSSSNIKLFVSRPNHKGSLSNSVFTLLLIGDSMTHQSSVANKLYKILDQQLEGSIRFVGTHHPIPDFEFYEKPDPFVFHEGYGGWTWNRFATHYKPEEAHIYNAPRSPFVFLGELGPELDIKRYFLEQNIVGGPDAIIFQLGINDTFLLSPDDPKSMEIGLDQVINNARELITSFHEAAPNSRIFVQTPPYFTKNTFVFDKKYGEAYGGVLRHQRIVAALIKKMLEELSYLPKVKIIPTHLMLDRKEGYDLIDPGHPNHKGSMEQTWIILASLLNKLNQTP